MFDIGKILIDGGIFSLIASLYLLGILRFNPRLFLQDYPQEIQMRVPPKSDQEKRQSLLLGIPFLVLLVVGPLLSTLFLQRGHGGELGFFPLFLQAFGVSFLFNLTDLLVLDWLVLCLITPRFLIIPGSEGEEGYMDYGFHFRGFLVGTLLSIISGGIIAGLVYIYCRLEIQ
jgi:hypothetical protein